MIPPNNFWWLSRSPRPPPTCLLFKQVWVVPPLSASKVFSDPIFWALSYDWSPPPPPPPPPPRKGINNDRSLMHFAIIMQHASMAYHMQRACKGPTIWLLREGGGVGWFQKKNILKSDSEHKKNLARKYLPYNSFVCQGKIFYHQRFGGKKFLRKPIKSPIRHSKSNGRPLITCRKCCCRLILRLRHQYLIVHDEFNTAGRLGTF